MSPFAANMSDQDMKDVAAYYAFLPRVPSNNVNENLPAPPIVVTGAPMRNIAPCGSCHGDVDNKAGSPWLGGQSALYIKAQLHAFATGARRSDIHQQMRNIARQMTAAMRLSLVDGIAQLTVWEEFPLLSTHVYPVNGRHLR